MKLLTILAILLSAAGALARDGGFAGNGGADNIPEHLTSAYFLDPNGESRVIHACVNAYDSQYAPARTLIAAKLFEMEFDQWKQFIEKNRINERPGIPKLATKLEMREHCKGDEDLTILLGVKTPEVFEAERLYYAPEGFAHPVSYDDTKGWGRGIIYVNAFSRPFETIEYFEREMRETYEKYHNYRVVSTGKEIASVLGRKGQPEEQKRKLPPEDEDFVKFVKARLAYEEYQWNAMPDSYLGVLFLHEIGHVFGCMHVDGTIMDSRISRFLMNSEDNLFERRYFTDRIEFARKLATCRECATTFTLGELASQNDRDLFKDLFGRELRGNLAAQATVRGNSIEIEFLTSEGEKNWSRAEKTRRWFQGDGYAGPKFRLGGTVDTWREAPSENTVFKTYYQGTARSSIVNTITQTGRLKGRDGNVAFNLMWNHGERIELQFTTAKGTYALKGWITELAPGFLGIDMKSRWLPDIIQLKTGVKAEDR